MPEALRGVFASEQVPLLQRYAELLATEGVVRGLIGPREVPRLWERHLENCAALAAVLPRTGSVCDIGSGAGLPGLVVALALPEVQVTLVEPLLRRTVFLSEVVDELALPNVEVVRARADALHGQRSFDVVTSRALAPLERLLVWSMPLVAAGGSLVALKGSSVGDEVEAAAGVLASFHCDPAEIIELGMSRGGSEDGPESSARGDGPSTYAVRVSWGPEGPVGLRPQPRNASSRSGPRRSSSARSARTRRRRPS